MDIPQIINKQDASMGEMGQDYLAVGKNVAMRRWEEEKGHHCEASSREYEVVGYLIIGQLEVDIDGQTAMLHPGDSWLVPAGAPHSYSVIKAIVAIEASSPPARFVGRDE